MANICILVYLSMLFYVDDWTSETVGICCKHSCSKRPDLWQHEGLGLAKRRTSGFSRACISSSWGWATGMNALGCLLGRVK